MWRAARAGGDGALAGEPRRPNTVIGVSATRSAAITAAAEVCAIVAAHADEGQRERRLPAPVVEALAAAGLMRLCVPEVYGGPEVDPMTLVECIDLVARADGAAGWCTMIASTTSSLSVFLDSEWAQVMYGDPAIVTGGVFAPNGVGVGSVRDGVAGFDVDGRWAWGSGTQHCRWILGGARCDDDSFRLCWFDHGDVTFHDTWHTSGMRGTGSLDFSVHGAFVPSARTMQPGVTRPVVDCALARFPNFALLAAAVSAVALGIGRRAIDELVDLAAGKHPQFSSKTLAASGFTQVEVARAEGRLRAAKAFVLDELNRSWSTVLAGDDVSLEQRAGIRLAAVHAAAESVAVVDAAFTVAGGTAVYDSNVLGRCLRDVHVVTQHIQTAPKLNETIGKVLLSQPADTAMF
jgi:alkylation response protein AidB-like acyl-CoA dehydrogenase